MSEIAYISKFINRSFELVSHKHPFNFKTIDVFQWLMERNRGVEINSDQTTTAIFLGLKQYLN